MLTAGITLRKFGNSPLYRPLRPSSRTNVFSVSVIVRGLMRALSGDSEDCNRTATSVCVCGVCVWGGGYASKYSHNVRAYYTSANLFSREHYMEEHKL